MSKQLLSRREVAQRLSISERTVQRMTGDGPLRPVYIGRLVRYHAEDVDRLTVAGCAKWKTRNLAARRGKRMARGQS
jgi:excisionase family DNA binding protein